MGKEVLMFGDIEIGKNKFQLIFSDEEQMFFNKYLSCLFFLLSLTYRHDYKDGNGFISTVELLFSLFMINQIL